MALDEPIPSDDQAAAAKWLTENSGRDELMDVSHNGLTTLFWYVAGLLAQYKGYVPVVERKTPTP